MKTTKKLIPLSGIFDDTARRKESLARRAYPTRKKAIEAAEWEIVASTLVCSDYSIRLGWVITKEAAMALLRDPCLALGHRNK